MLLPPGPEQSSLIIILRLGWDQQSEVARRKTLVSQDRRRKPIACPTGLEQEFEGKLNQTWVIHRIVYDAESGRGIQVRSRAAELRMIEQIEELGPQVKPHPFTRQHEMLDH